MNILFKQWNHINVSDDKKYFSKANTEQEQLEKRHLLQFVGNKAEEQISKRR